MGVQVPPRTLAYFVSSLYGAKSLFRRPTTKRAVTWFWRRCYSDSGLHRQSFSNSHCRCRCSTPTGMGSEQIHQATRVHRPSHAANKVCLRIAAAASPGTEATARLPVPVQSYDKRQSPSKRFIPASTSIGWAAYVCGLATALVESEHATSYECLPCNIVD